MPTDSKHTTEFIQVSRILTGEGSLDPVLAERLYHRLKIHFGEDLDTLINACQSNWANPAQDLLGAVNASKPLARVARAVIRAWYTGEFKPSKEVTDGPQTPGEYAHGLLWEVRRTTILSCWCGFSS
jgi:hypothetical protein